MSRQQEAQPELLSVSSEGRQGRSMLPTGEGGRRSIVAPQGLDDLLRDGPGDQQLPASAVANAGPLSVQVFTPEYQGGGTSVGAQTLTVGPRRSRPGRA